MKIAVLYLLLSTFFSLVLASMIRHLKYRKESGYLQFKTSTMKKLPSCQFDLRIKELNHV